MYLYFSNWTSPHTSKQVNTKFSLDPEAVIKVYAYPTDPQEILKRPLIIIYQESSPFADEDVYKYGDKQYTGIDLEEYLDTAGLSPNAKEATRALFRFSNSPQVEIAQFAMQQTDDLNEPLFKHPLEHLHGIQWASRRPNGRRDLAIHLDIFTPRSIERLGHMVDITDQSTLVSSQEVSLLLKHHTKNKESENASHKERA